MPELVSWAFPAELQPDRDDVTFDLARALDSIVALRVEIPDDAFTAAILGTERAGSGVVIDDRGLVLTIGYLITEAESIWITTQSGKVVPGHALAYDQETGLGLVMPLGQLDVAPVARVALDEAELDDEVYVLSHGGRAHALRAEVFARREFAGYWEYLLDEAIFTQPAHPEWSGAALLDAQGRLAGIGSLFVQEADGDDTIKGNMFVPAALIDGILDDVLRRGQAVRAPRPWLGVYSTETKEGITVQGVSESGPSAEAGVEPGDVIRAVAGETVDDLGEFYRIVWQRGHAGVDVPLTLVRDGKLKQVTVQSIDRNALLKKPSLQ